MSVMENSFQRRYIICYTTFYDGIGVAKFTGIETVEVMQVKYLIYTSPSYEQRK